MSSVLVVTEKAFYFLLSLKELGLVDERMLEEIMNRLMLMDAAEVDIDSMKRIAAVVIFEHQFDGREDYFGIFDEEWRLLFN